MECVFTPIVCYWLAQFSLFNTHIAYLFIRFLPPSLSHMHIIHHISLSSQCATHILLSWHRLVRCTTCDDSHPITNECSLFHFGHFHNFHSHMENFCFPANENNSPKAFVLTCYIWCVWWWRWRRRRRRHITVGSRRVRSNLIQSIAYVHQINSIHLPICRTMLMHYNLE